MSRIKYALPQHIVVCDDEELDAELLIETLQRNGYGESHHAVHSGRELLKYLRGPGTPRPCLVLLDLRMAGMSGMETLEAIRRDATLRDLVVFCFSNSAEPADVARVWNAGVQGYLQKPAGEGEDLADLLLAMDVVLRRLVLPYPPRA